MKEEIKILLADDHTLVRNGLMLMLELQNAFIAKITEAVNGKEVIEKLEYEDFDIILLDINMPDIDGLAVLRRLKMMNSKIPVLILSMHNEENIIKQALELGASGYILKNSGIDELVKAIGTILKNQKYYCNEISQILINSKKNKEQKRDKTSKLDPLTKREIQILSLLVAERSNQDIADSLLISRRTIEGHRKNIMNKLQIKTTVGLVVYALKNGIKV